MCGRISKSRVSRGDPERLAPAPGHQASRTALAFDARLLQDKAQLPAQEIGQPCGLVLDGVPGRGLLVEPGDLELVVPATIGVGGGPYPLALSPDGSHLYVAAASGRRIALI